MSLMCRIYIGSVYYEANEDAVSSMFLPFGPLKSVCMTWDNVTGRHKGFCFLEYEIPEAAQLALEQMNNAILGGRTIKVGRPSNMPQAMPIIEQIIEESKNYSRIFVSSLHAALNENDVRSVFESFGNIVSINMPRKLDEEHCPHKGYAFIEYDSHQACQDAISGMNMFDLGGQLLRVGKAITPPDPLLSFLGPAILTPEEQLAQSIKTAKQAAASYCGLSDALKSEQFTVIAQECMEMAGIDITDLKDLIPPGMSLKLIKEQERMKEENSKMPEVDTDALQDFVVPDLTSNTVVNYGEPVVPVITVPTPSDIQASEQSNLNHQMQQIVPPVKQELPSATQPAPPPQDVDVEFSHSLSAQEEISISGGGARQRLMAKLMRESRSRTIVLRNMVTVDEIDEYLEDEITEECNKYGKVSKVLIYQEQQGVEEDAPTIVKIFVSFTDPSGAEEAVKAMNGRYFAGRPIVAQIYDQGRFDYEDLAG
ncbi:poly(U)-binding-splicing factor PUF60-like isoform X2 [Convolutriloba macropyga]